MSSRWMVRAVVMAALTCAAVEVGAVERKPLPAFDLVSADGRTLSSQRLVRSGPWVMIYVTTDCVPCTTILASLDATDAPAMTPHLVIVVATKTVDALRMEMARYPGLASAVWLADMSGGVRQHIEAATAPVVFGLRDRMVEWSVSGVLIDPSDVRTLLTRWIEAIGGKEEPTGSSAPLPDATESSGHDADANGPRRS